MKAKLILSVLLAAVCGLSACKNQPIAESKPITESNKTETPAHSSKNALDWAGTYRGILPCADCEGIEMVLTLRKDLTYAMMTRYLGKKDAAFETKGTFSWNELGNKISLDGKNKSSQATGYFVGENRLTQLDKSGNPVSGSLADRYTLRKGDAGLTGKYWKLTEIFDKPVVAGKWDQKEPHIILKTDGNRLTGTGGCNAFSGSYELQENNRIAFSEIASTLMACPDMETESRLLEALEKADSYVLKGDTLFLHKARMAPLARFEVVYLR